MPPRKSNVSTVSNGDQEGPGSPPSKSHRESIGVEDLTLPKSIVGRLAKGILPANTNIGKDALLAMHKSATVFVSYIASAANENTQNAGKKTIMPADVFQALKDADLGDFLPRLEAELKKYNETQCDKRNNYRRRVKEEKAAATATSDVNETTQDVSGIANGANGTVNGHIDDLERPSKKMRGENGTALQPEADDEINGSDEDDAGKEDESDASSDEDVEDDEEDDEVEQDDGQDRSLEDRLEESERADEDDEALDHDDSD